MDDAQILLRELKGQGLTKKQVDRLFAVLLQWLEENYPVFAALSKKEIMHIRKCNKKKPPMSQGYGNGKSASS